MKSVAIIAVVIPSFRVKKHILGVIDEIGAECSMIYVVDDACPDGSGDFVREHCKDPRVKVITHAENQGVGGAVVTGYKAALEAGADIMVKLDGDGQMDPSLIPNFVAPIISGRADYTKGNRFNSLYAVRQMPRVRLIGNAVLSFMTKLSSGYWRAFDPTNGYTAIHRETVKRLDLKGLAKRYFFETDMLIKLGDIRAKVLDVMMDAKYGDEESGLKISRVTTEFLFKHMHATVRRLFYGYFLRDFSLASMNLMLGFWFTMFGIVFGAYSWHQSIVTGVLASTGTVMLAMLPLILGIQFLLFFLSLDIANEPTETLQSQTLPHDLDEMLAGPASVKEEEGS